MTKVCFCAPALKPGLGSLRMQILIFAFNLLGFHKNEVGVSKGKLNSQHLVPIFSRRTAPERKHRTHHLRIGNPTGRFDIKFALESKKRGRDSWYQSAVPDELVCLSMCHPITSLRRQHRTG